jgi:hypothetical protein
MENRIEKEKEALQNAADYCGLLIIEHHNQDKRQKNKFVAILNDGTSMSPVLNYNDMNHFLWGYISHINYMDKIKIKNILDKK